MSTSLIDGGAQMASLSAPQLWSGVALAPPPAPPLQLLFQVSQNEEHVFVDICCGPRRVSLGERAHHYVLLLLARLRLDDARRGFDASSQGWIDVTRLAGMLGLDGGHLNIQLFRARRQLEQTAPELAQALQLVERRRGEIRFGAQSFRIVRGLATEAEFAPQDHVMRGNPV